MEIVHGTSRLGERKVFSARKRLRDINPDIQIDGCGEPFTSENALRIAMIKNLRGGVNAWAQNMDPTQPIY